MSVTFFLKNNLNKLPLGVSVGQYIAKIPYQYRPGIGGSYSNSQEIIDQFKHNSVSDKQEYIFYRVKKLVEHAYANTVFYKKYYDDCEFDIKLLKSFSDLEKIPFVSKSILSHYSIDEISYKVKGRVLSNTGGSSGAPFKFYTSPDAIGHEWAHIHEMWGKIGFKPDMLKLNFYGRSSVLNFVDYDLIRHSLVADIYSDFNKIEERLYEYIIRNNVSFLHGYPSSLYEFACYCEKSPRLKKLLSATLRGAFLSSEFPHDRYRNKIESVFGIKTQAFYGHTERCVMAYEVSRFKYKTFQSYGFTELNGTNLVGTSYNSFATPLIRYDTGDTVTSEEFENGMLDSFVMKDGRSGEYILDVNNKKIPLTGLIFGRHHEIFNYVSNIQIAQKKPGEAVILYCPKTKLSTTDARSLFDANNVNVDFEFFVMSSPIKTVSGKLQLKINYDEWLSSLK